MNRSVRWWTRGLIYLPLALSFAPAVPPHGYGLVPLWPWSETPWGHVPLMALVLPAVLWFAHPDQHRRLLLYAAGIFVQFLAFPDPDLGFLGWVMLLPYLLARRCDDGAHWWRAAFLYGFFKAHVGYYWLGNIHYTAWLGVALAAALVFATVFEGLLRFLKAVPFALRVGTAWVLFEWVHTWFIGGLPWLFLGHTQYRYLPLVQIADVAGVPAVSFLLAFVQAAVLSFLLDRRGRAQLAFAGALFAGVIGYGLLRPKVAASTRRDPGVLMVQSAIPHHVKEAGDLSPMDIWNALRRLTREGLRDHPETQLVIWPETMNPWYYIEDDPAALPSFNIGARRNAREFRRPFVYGANTYVSKLRFARKRGHNSAVHVDVRGEVREIYRKQRLVPMGEEFSLRRFFPETWCDAWMDALRKYVGYPSSCDLESGEGFVPLDAGPGLQCAVLICFEGLYPDLAREALREGDPDVLLQLVNNGWFGASFEQRQFVASWVFRAIETRTPFFACANAGITCAVAPSGELLGAVDRVMQEGFLYAEIPQRWPESLYLRGGYFVLPGVLLVVGGVFLVLARRRRGSGGSGPDDGGPR